MAENLKTINPRFQCFLKTRRGNVKTRGDIFVILMKHFLLFVSFPVWRMTQPHRMPQPCIAQPSQAPTASFLSHRLLRLPCDLHCFPATTMPSLWPTLLPSDYRIVICGMDPVCCESSSWMENEQVKRSCLVVSLNHFIMFD